MATEALGEQGQNQKHICSSILVRSFDRRANKIEQNREYTGEQNGTEQIRTVQNERMSIIVCLRGRGSFVLPSSLVTLDSHWQGRAYQIVGVPYEWSARDMLFRRKPSYRWVVTLET
ncbi:hypothetical protein M0804_001765 [Polistes exclamans]|nr:hypothetical protein M0804_001765 [Polistes exclamans]